MKRKEKKEEESEEILSSAYEEEEGGVIEEGEEEGREEGEEGVEMEEGEDNSVIQFSGGGERTKRIVQGCLTLIVVVYFLCGLLLYVFQGNFIFPGTWLPNPTTEGAGIQVMMVNDTDDDPSGVAFRLFYARARGSIRRDDVILFFGGNAEMEKTLRYRAQSLAHYGYRTLAVEYPGYGETPGSPDLHSISKVADCAAKYAASMARSANVYAIGASIGTYSAMRVHAKGYAKKSVLQAPFMDLPEVAGNLYWFYPVTRLMRAKYHFNNRDSVLKISRSCQKKHPNSLIIHGDVDTIVPHAFGEQVADEMRHCSEFVTAIGSGHNDIPLSPDEKFGVIISSFLQDEKNQ